MKIEPNQQNKQAVITIETGDPSQNSWQVFGMKKFSSSCIVLTLRQRSIHMRSHTQTHTHSLTHSAMQLSMQPITAQSFTGEQVCATVRATYTPPSSESSTGRRHPRTFESAATN